MQRAVSFALALLLGLVFFPKPSEAIEFSVRGVPVRLQITNSLFLGYHNIAEPLNPKLGPPYGDPLNPFSGLLFCSGAADPAACQRKQGFGNNRLSLTRGGAGQNYFDLFNRFNLLLSVWRIQLGMRVDTSAFLNGPQPLDPLDPDQGGCAKACQDRFLNTYVTPTGLEKVFLTYTDRRLEVVLGDAYAVFGRGLVLSVRKVDELGIDTTILGGKLVYNPGRFKLIGVAGVANIQNVDEPTGRFEQDPFDLILGGRGEVRLWDKIIFGAHLSGGTPLREVEGQRPGRLAYGATIEAPRLLPWLDLYLEGAGLNLFHDENAPASSGYALYGSATAYAGPLTMLFEGKHYSDFMTWRGSTKNPEFVNIAYNLPPTVERLLTEVEDPQSNISGGRVLFTYRASSAFSLVISNAMFQQEQLGTQVLHALRIHDPYAGLMVRWQSGVSHLFVNGGYRYEYDTDKDEPFKKTGWFDWDFIQGLPKNLSIESQGRALFRTRVGEKDWVEGNAYLALKWTPYLIAAMGLEWSTRTLTITEERNDYLSYAFFPNAFLQYNITSKSSVRFFAGGQRGGLKCVSGICRVYPDLRGARLELVLRF